MLLNYDKFVEGITEIGLVEDDLQVRQHLLTPPHNLTKLLPHMLNSLLHQLKVYVRFFLSFL